MPNAVIAHEPSGRFDLDALKREAQGVARPGRHGPRADGDDRRSVSPGTKRRGTGATATANGAIREFHVVAIDYGIKRNILRQLAGNRCRVTVVPAQTSADDILALKPDGILLSNGPGDPAATGEYAVPVIRTLIEQKPVFGICLGHQMLALARRRQDDEDASGPPRREPSGEGPHHRQGRDRLHEPRLRRRSREPAGQTRWRPTSRCSTAPIAAWRSRTGRCSRSSTIPRPRPARATATACSSVLSG